MTDRPDQAAPGTPVADLLALLVQLPPEQAGQVRFITLAPRPGPDQPFLRLDVDAPPVGQNLADHLGLTDPPTTTPQATGDVTWWEGTWNARPVAVCHFDLARESLLDPDQEHQRSLDAARALTGRLARLHLALTALEDPTDLGEAWITASSARVYARTTDTARALAARLCPQAPGQTRHPASSPDLPEYQYWEAATEDTTIRGPLCHHHTDTRHDDTDEDLP